MVPANTSTNSSEAPTWPSVVTVTRCPVARLVLSLTAARRAHSCATAAQRMNGV